MFLLHFLKGMRHIPVSVSEIINSQYLGGTASRKRRCAAKGLRSQKVILIPLTFWLLPAVSVPISSESEGKWTCRGRECDTAQGDVSVSKHDLFLGKHCYTAISTDTPV